jgi:NAD(P)-dependent dehydrogenase (short-subunit alcohol dehydrogenase family)
MIGERLLVIGGTSGIGREVGRQARAAGAEVLVTGRRPDAAEPDTAALDAHDEAALEAFFAAVGPVDHVVSLVGDSMSGGFLSTSPDTMRHVLESKFLANWSIARHAAAILRPGGSLTFTSGTGGRPHEVSATYVANLAIEALVQGLAYELAPDHRVNAVAPTFLGTRTRFWRDVPGPDLEQLEAGFAAKVPLRRLAEVGEVAAAYLHLLTNRYITGHTLAVDGGVMLG